MSTDGFEQARDDCARQLAARKLHHWVAKENIALVSPDADGSAGQPLLWFDADGRLWAVWCVIEPSRERELTQELAYRYHDIPTRLIVCPPIAVARTSSFSELFDLCGWDEVLLDQHVVDMKLDAEWKTATTRTDERAVTPERELQNAWADLHLAIPAGWIIGRPNEDAERGEWLLTAFDTSDRPRMGPRGREWTAAAQSEADVISEMARCLPEISEGRVPK